MVGSLNIISGGTMHFCRFGEGEAVPKIRLLQLHFELSLVNVVNI